MLTGGEHVRVSWTVLWVVSRVYRVKTGPKQAQNRAFRLGPLQGPFRACFGVSQDCQMDISGCAHIPLNMTSCTPRDTPKPPFCTLVQTLQKGVKTGPKQAQNAYLGPEWPFWACFGPVLRAF